MMSSVWPWLAITTSSSYLVSFNALSSPASKSWPSVRKARGFFPPMLLRGMIKAMPVPGTSMLSSRCMAPFTARQAERVTTEKVTTFSVFSRPK